MSKFEINLEEQPAEVKPTREQESTFDSHYEVAAYEAGDCPGDDISKTASHGGGGKDWIPYMERIVSPEIGKLRSATQGERNDMLNATSFNLFGWAHKLGLDGMEQHLRNELQAAGKHIGLEAKEIRTTINSAFKARDEHKKKVPEDKLMNRVAPINSGVTIENETGAMTGDIHEFIKRYVYVTIGDKVFDLTSPANYAVCKLNEFKNQSSNKIAFEQQETKIGTKIVKVKIANQWMEHADRLSAYGERFYPGKDTLFEWEGVSWVNSFYMPKKKLDKGTDKLTLFYDHLNMLFPIECEREWFIDWMAYNLQYPGKRCKVTPLHISEFHRTGRGWIVECMETLLGKHNVTKTTLKTLSGEGAAGQFHDYFNKSLLCAIEETREKGEKQYAVCDKIRGLLTEKRLEVNLKYGGKQTIDVFTNFFLMSNHDDALVIDDKDGRINVFRTDTPAKPDSYFITLYGWLETSGIDQLHYMLMSRDLSAFNFQTSMKNEARRELISGLVTDVEVYYNDLVDEIMSNVEDKNEYKIPSTMIKKEFINEVMFQANDFGAKKQIIHLINNDSRVVEKVFNDHVNKPKRLISFDPSISGKDAMEGAKRFLRFTELDKSKFSPIDTDIL